MMLSRRVLLGVSLLTPLTGWTAGPVEAALYVSTAGNDRWSGRLADPAPDGEDGPLATIEEAKRRVAELRRQAGERGAPIVVSIRGGLYALEQPLIFTPEDSGAENSPTVYQAFGDERPVLSGGARISGWKTTPQGWWRTTLEAVRKGEWSFAQLFVDDQRRWRPRLPRRGYYNLAGRPEPASFGFADDDINPAWSNLGDVEVLLFHDWSASRMRIDSVSTSERRVRLTGRTWEPCVEGARYLVINVPEALGEPGEWNLDRASGALTYIPRPGESLDRAVVIAPRLERVLVLQGDPSAKRWVRHIHFRGLTFAHANWTLPSAGHSFPQAELSLDAAVSAIGARDILFERCAVRHVGGYAMAFGAGSRDNRLEACELVDLGAGGVKIGHAGVGDWDQIERLVADPDLHVSHHVIRNCLIAHGGRLHPAGVGVWIGQSSHNVVERNDVFDFYETGISVGWTFGYGRSDAHDNDIGFNHIHTIGQGVMSDMGGIYTLGVQPGTVAHDNHVHHIQSFSYGGWGLYTDEGSSEIVFERNLVHHAKTGGFFQHFGRDNQVRNNIFAFAETFQLEGTRPEPHVAFVFERNIAYWDNDGPLMGGCHSDSPPCPINFSLDYNVYWRMGGPPVFPGGLTFAQWRERQGQDRHSLVADPLFVDAGGGDFRLKPGSPAPTLGFQPFEPSAGRQTPSDLTKNLPPVLRAFG
jgi:hypothetical protein